jgi:alginate O-acetyltransferase complex protein AlgJ
MSQLLSVGTVDLRAADIGVVDVGTSDRSPSVTIAWGLVRTASAQTLLSWATVFTLGLGLCVPLLAWLTGWSDAAIQETQKRPPAPFPTLDVRWRGPIPVPRSASLAVWPGGVEAWWNDRWGFRRPLQQTYTAARLAGFTPKALDLPRQGQGGQVVVGNQGWLYYGGQNALESYRATRPFTPEELANWVRVFRERRDWLAARGIPYVILLAPDKSTLYPEYLPRSVIKTGSETRLDQLLAALQSVENLAVVDPRDRLREANLRAPTFTQTDSHWNAWGAFTACSQLLERDEFQATDAQGALDLNDYTLDVAAIRGWGDLATLLDSPWPFIDDAVRLTPREPTQVRLRIGPRTVQLVRRLDNPRREQGRAFVLHDSFFLPMLPFFAEQFRETTCVAYREFDAERIDRERPDIVVQQLVERSLVTLKPENPELPPIP